MRSLLLLTVWLTLLVPARAEFCAYYTKVDSGESFEEFSRTGPEADIVVRDIGPDHGRFVFWRGSSYLPYFEAQGGKWFVPELTERQGDGPRQRPDNVNTYSVARIIESSPAKVVIHWRYLPKFEGTNPHYNAVNLPMHLKNLGGKPPAHLVDPARFVDEYFTITPDGKVTRTFKPGTEKHHDWIAPRNFTVQEIKLTEKGVAIESTKVPPPPEPGKPIAGSAIQDKVIVEPVKWWKFNEGAGDITKESAAGDSCAIAGHMSYWKQGVSGTALAFDGYHSVVRLPAEKAPAISDAVTLEAWVAIGAYPWNWTPVVQQGHEESYSLTIGPHGSVAMSVKVGNDLTKAESKPQLATKRWYHVAGSYDKAAGTARVFIDGQLCGEQAAPKDGIARSESPIQIGKGAPLGQSDPVRFADPHDFSFDGLIDEVRIYNVAMTAEQVAASCALIGMSDLSRAKPDLDRRVLPAGLKTGKFGAYYTHLPFYDTWEGMFRFSEHPDVVVEFDKQPTSFVFWRGVGFITMMVNEKGEYDPFTIGDFQKGDVYAGELTDYSVFPSWNHWPVAQMPSDGRYAKHPDRTAHSSLTHVVPAVYKNQEGKRPYQERLLLEGMSKQSPAELATLARSWLQAPEIKALAGCAAEPYNPAKREYPLRASAQAMSVAIAASPEHPLVNVCFTVRSWGAGGAASVLMNGNAPDEVRQGTFVDTDGTRTMVIWIKVATSSPTEFTISGAKPV